MLKSGNVAGQVADDQIDAAAHFLLEGGTGAVARLALAASPSAKLSLHAATQDTITPNFILAESRTTGAV